jgi:hypothetical protein
MGLYSLAHVLHKSIGEIEQMTHREYIGWYEYFSTINGDKKPNLLDDPQALMKALI